jgi:hypothetical protein
VSKAQNPAGTLGEFLQTRQNNPPVLDRHKTCYACDFTKLIPGRTPCRMIICNVNNPNFQTKTGIF